MIKENQFLVNDNCVYFGIVLIACKGRENFDKISIHELLKNLSLNVEENSMESLIKQVESRIVECFDGEFE